MVAQWIREDRTKSRRRFITTLGGVICGVVIPGCVNSDAEKNQSSSDDTSTQMNNGNTSESSSDPIVKLRDKTVKSGESGEIMVKALNVDAIGVKNPIGQVPRLENSTKPHLDYTNATSPTGIEIRNDSYPPSWSWDDIQPKVTIKIPYNIPDTANDGEHEYSIVGWQNKYKSSSEKVVEKAKIMVE